MRIPSVSGRLVAVASILILRTGLGSVAAFRARLTCSPDLVPRRGDDRVVRLPSGCHSGARSPAAG